MKVFFLIILLFLTTFAKSQNDHDPEWWVNKHGWDGFTHWTSYMKIRPKYMGPSALPVPELQEARVSTEWNVELRPETHFNKGDFTTDIYTSIIAPLGKRASFEVYLVPVEYYNISDTNIRDERMMRSRNAKGWGGGDFWIGTHIQLLKDHERLPDIQLSSYLKSASGLNLHHARFTDAPGYTFFLSAGDYFFGDEKSASYLRWYLNAGMYVWQQYDGQHLQNDAINYGAGLSYKRDAWMIKLGMAGYAGYLGDGDKPLVMRSQIGYSTTHFSYSLRYQWGIYDFPYHSIGLSVKRKFNWRNIS